MNRAIRLKIKDKKRLEAIDNMISSIKKTTTFQSRPIDLSEYKVGIDMTTRQCCICDKDSTSIGIFIPDKDNSERFGAIDGFGKAIFYGLCDDCFDDPKWPQKMEEAILQGMLIDTSQKRH